ncbi:MULTISPECIES: hypothetical protein [unclassified Lysinibacillus]|uniref:hypothetical protein n=1 Tax=unclassified Lysinibacillus TaxID=2636778 RepID=UPI00201B412A|nr:MULTISPECIES: hypothetical protein [unclassified Lysinibacillus]
MKIFQQNIFGGEDVILSDVPVIVLKNRSKEGRYLAESSDLGDWDDVDLDVTMDDIENAFIIVRDDYTEPSSEDVVKKRREFEAYKLMVQETFGSDVYIGLDFEEALKHYDPVNITIPVTAYNEAAERNGWALIE